MLISYENDHEKILQFKLGVVIDDQPVTSVMQLEGNFIFVYFMSSISMA